MGHGLLEYSRSPCVGRENLEDGVIRGRVAINMKGCVGDGTGMLFK